MSAKLLVFVLVLLVSATIADRTGSIRYLYKTAAVSSALAAGHGSPHGNNGNENQNWGGNGNGNNGLGNGNSGRSDDDSGGKPIPSSQDDFNQAGWQGNSLPDFSGKGSSLPDFGSEKKNWESYLKDEAYPGFDADKLGFEQNFTPKDMKEGAGRNPPRASPATKDTRQLRHRNELAANVDPRSYSRTEVLAVNLSSIGFARARRLGFQIMGSAPPPENSPVAVLMAPAGIDALDAITLLRENLPAEHFQLNRLYRLYRPAMKEDGEPRAGHPATLGGKICAGDHCYARAAIQWKDRLSSCARDVKVGVIDTNIDLKHPAFRQQNITQKLLIPAGRQAAASWHGTGVLALLAGRSDSSTPGLIPEATFFAAGIFYSGGDGDAVTDTVSILRALDWMAASGTKLVNMSFSGPQDDLVQAKIERLSAQGMVFSAAAGNDGPTAEPAYPAAYPQVIAVTAVTKELKNYPYANRGGHIDVAAPGVDIWTAWPDSREGYRSGTSFASPFVAAVLAILPPGMLRPPKESLFEQLRTADLGQPGRDPVYGRGLLQAPSSCPMASGETANNTRGWVPRTN